MSWDFRRRRAVAGLAALVLPAALLGGCGLLDTNRKIEKPPPQLVTAAGANVEVGNVQSGSPVELRADQTLTVRLRFEGPATAEWILVDFVPGVFADPGKPRFEQDLVAGKYGQVGGTQTWRFAAARPGQATLRFELRVPRSREPALDVASYDVTVR